jgi:hypothetical protein
MTKVQHAPNPRFGIRDALIVALILGNLILVSFVIYQATEDEKLGSQNAAIQQEVASMQFKMAQLMLNISGTKAQNAGLSASIRALNLTADSMKTQVGLLQAYLNMQNSTTLVSNRTIAVLPPIGAGLAISPDMTPVFNFTAEYAGYLIVSENVTGGAVISVNSYSTSRSCGQMLCETDFDPETSASMATFILPVLPGHVTVELGTFSGNSPQLASITIVYVT